MRQSQLSWGVVPMLGDVQGDMRRVIDQARDAVRAAGLVKAGDLAVFTAGDPDTSPVEDVAGHAGSSATNVMYVVQIR